MGRALLCRGKGRLCSVGATGRSPLHAPALNDSALGASIEVSARGFELAVGDRAVRPRRKVGRHLSRAGVTLSIAMPRLRAVREKHWRPTPVCSPVSAPQRATSPSERHRDALILCRKNQGVQHPDRMSRRYAPQEERWGDVPGKRPCGGVMRGARRCCLPFLVTHQLVPAGQRKELV
ncbi:MAG: hypothetical protein KatS3mg077_2183 [Candidatus Binatia bacterium]|nr:MAG: hypothetical protein KatS3mg077_2183 [Candidatus Binatia bacterium]